jgi:hypothetical protein
MVVSKEDKLVVTKDPEFERTTDRNFDHSMRLCLRLPGVVLVASIRWVEVSKNYF